MTSKQRAYLKGLAMKMDADYPAWQGRSYTGKHQRLLTKHLQRES